MFGKPHSLLGRYEFESRQEYKRGATLNYWAGVICGMCAGAILFVVMMFVVIEQNNELKDKLEVEIAQLEEKVADHEEVMNYFGWLKEREEKEE